MINNHDKVPDHSRKEAGAIYNEIIKMLSMEDSNKTFSEKGVLSARLKNLIALGSVLAGQRSQDVASCVKESLRAGATREEIMEVLRLAIVMAEIPAKHYTEIVQSAIKVFEAED